MKYLKVLVVVLATTAVSLAGVTSAHAQGRRAGGAAGRAVPRAGGGAAGRVARPVIINPRGIGFGSYRPYYYPYGPGLTIGLGLGYPYGAVYPFYGSAFYGSAYGYYGGSAFGYYGPYGYGYPYGPAGYVSAYGGVRIEGAPRDAQVFADGYYVGIVDDFDGVFQHVSLLPGTHRIEIRPAGAPPLSFDVRLQPGQTITYRADLPRN